MIDMDIILKEIVLTLLNILEVTLFNCLFYFISHGWNITTFDMYRTNRKACTNAFILGATLYLLMLATSYTSDGTNAWVNIFTLIMALVYCALLYQIFINAENKIREIKRIEDDDDLP